MARHTDVHADLPSAPPTAHDDRRCEHCGRPHGHTLRCLPDGRWLSPEGLWFDSDGHPAPWPDVVDYAGVRMSRSVVGLYRRSRAAAKPQHLCRRCFLDSGRDAHRQVARVRSLMRFALGDLFEGAYSA
ncbi:hypothetical protein [Azospirillum canadense]|uniref:hypothetical protein n=1 Tax=Azospirillum canadense TaxID=403962 RepID=UPI002227DC03|nr:hypothetical protein [Azospirillum canadense]MCW2238965.1 ribosomal protein S14 [Azospirillum canadense]